MDPARSPVPDCHCESFSRSELLRQAAAQAGRGMPAIEPGMPVPAGTGLSRRSLLLRSAGLGLAAYGLGALAPSALEEGIATAAAAGPDPVLVSIFMAGGIDSLSVLAPVGDPHYRALRPTLALAAGDGTPFSEDGGLRWHPSAAGLSELHGEGKVSVLPAIGYDSPNQSHFTSRHFWEVGETDTEGRVGWLGRYLDRVGAADNPLQGLSLDPVLFPSLAPATVPAAAVSTPEAYSFHAWGVSGGIATAMHNSYAKLGSLPGGDEATRTARDAVKASMGLREKLQPFIPQNGQPAYTSPVAYPSGAFGKRLSALAAMLAAGLPIRCVTVNAPGGYDTHANQASSLPPNLKLTADTILAFQRDLEARGLADRVLTHLWSEFGRRPKENGSGTDHGAAGVSFVLGSRVRGQMIGEFPGLGRLDARDNLRATSDFRALYCSIVEQWLGTEADGIIPGASAFPRMPLIKA